MLKQFRTNVEGWVHESIQGEVIKAATLPAGKTLPNHLTPVVIDEASADSNSPSEYELFEVSPQHKRSYELGDSNKIRHGLTKSAVWLDEFANPYTSFSLKGNNFSYNSIMESSTAPSGYMPMGLLESDALLRVIRSSRLLREQNISTEWISRVFEPKELIYKGERVSQAEYKKRMLKDTADERGLEAMSKIALALEPMTFFITGRSMEINDRVGDFGTDTTASGLQRLKHIFNVYNLLHTKDDGFQALDIQNKADIKRYFAQVYPTLTGINLAKLHNAGLVHSFPGLGNTTALGGLVDLDSMKGAPLDMGDPAISVGDKAKDLLLFNDPTFEGSMSSVYSTLGSIGLLGDFYTTLNQAEYHITNSYNAHRQTLDDPAAELRERIYLNSADITSAGTTGLRAYQALDKSGAKELWDSIWVELTKRFHQTTSSHNIIQDALIHADGHILQMHLDQKPTITLSDPALIKKITHKIINNHRNSIARTPGIGRDIADNKSLDIASLVPEKYVRKRLAEGYAQYIGHQFAASFAKENSSKKRQRKVYQFTRKHVARALREMENVHKKGDWDEYLIDILSARYENSGGLVFKGKSVFSYGGVSFDELKNLAENAGVSITMLDDVLMESNMPDVILMPNEQSTPVRALVTSQSNPTMIYRKYIYDTPDIGYKAGSGFNANKDFVAWMYEATDDKPAEIVVFGKTA